MKNKKMSKSHSRSSLPLPKSHKKVQRTVSKYFKNNPLESTPEKLESEYKTITPKPIKRINKPIGKPTKRKDKQTKKIKEDNDEEKKHKKRKREPKEPKEPIPELEIKSYPLQEFIQPLPQPCQPPVQLECKPIKKSISEKDPNMELRLEEKEFSLFHDVFAVFKTLERLSPAMKNLLRKIEDASDSNGVTLTFPLLEEDDEKPYLGVTAYQRRSFGTSIFDKRKRIDREEECSSTEAHELEDFIEKNYDSDNNYKENDPDYSCASDSEEDVASDGSSSSSENSIIFTNVANK